MQGPFVVGFFLGGWGDGGTTGSLFWGFFFYLCNQISRVLPEESHNAATTNMLFSAGFSILHICLEVFWGGKCSLLPGGCLKYLTRLMLFLVCCLLSSTACVYECVSSPHPVCDAVVVFVRKLCLCPGLRVQYDVPNGHLISQWRQSHTRQWRLTEC